MSRRGLRRVVFAAGCVSTAWACTLLNPLDEYGPGKPKTSGDGSVDPPPPATSQCGSLRWPAKPAKDDGTDANDYVFAANALSLGTPPTPATPPGYDLDGVCTCYPSPSSCLPPAGQNPCDTDAGVDIAGTRLLSSLVPIALFQTQVDLALKQGKGGFVIQLTKYNGGLDDRNVAVALYSSNGTEPASGTTDNTPPVHDGSDRWTVDPAAVKGTSGPPYTPNTLDENAYVSGGTLVATVDVALHFGDLVVDLKGAVLTAKLVKQGSSFQVRDGLLAGRWPTKNLLTSLDTVKAPGSKDGLCGTQPTYIVIKDSICNAVDLVANRADDGQQLPCDAVGTSVFFAAEPAQLGSILADKAPTHYCGDSYADDCR